jgi:multiple sugar transport system substrate-binding protein
MKTKRILALYIVVMFSVTIFGGWSAFAKKAEKVSLTYSIWDQNQKASLTEIANEFNKKNPNISVTIEVTPWTDYWTKMETAATGGALADILWMNGPNFQKYASNDIIEPLDSYSANDKFSFNNFPKALVDLYTYNGKKYGMPKDFDTIGLWYNKKLFDEAKLKYPDATWDWNKLLSAAKKLTNPKKGVWGFAATLDNQVGYYNLIYQNKGTVISKDGKKSGFDDPNTIAAIKYWSDMINVYKVSPDLKRMTDTDPDALFMSGKIAMKFSGSWGQQSYIQNEYAKKNINCAPLPKGKTNAVIIHGLSTVISANSAHKTEAWQFLKFMGSKQAALIMASKGGVIPAYNGTQAAWINSNKTYNLKIFIDQTKYAIPYPVSKNTSAWQDSETKYLTKIMSGAMKVVDGCKILAKEMNGYLAEE